MKIIFRLYNGYEVVEMFPGGFCVLKSFGFKQDSHKQAIAWLKTKSPTLPGGAE